ncbi:NYN domain-containing protein [Rhizobium sp. 007]|uniref:NYN domain-containing protein n=1 Tax=Rhizobium sp. 007 TaxID=2785056 RepID=UPI001890AA1D|nr:NYN domain-containing protein [Rhizobium sp. 007]QPB24407.1 NYN domain-containing protein [Rhizobium sp. 007]
MHAVAISDGLLEEIAQIGEASFRRIYGDSPAHARRHGRMRWQSMPIVRQQRLAYATGKNASDIALVVDAMDFPHNGRFGGFCLREQGVDVFGFG